MGATTTLVAVVGALATELVAEVAANAANVAAEFHAAPSNGGLPERSAALAATWQRAERHGPIYTLVDVDPIALVVEHWSARLEGSDHEIESAIGLAPLGSAPQYFMVSSDLEGTSRHWYWGLLADLSPARVLPITDDPDSILRVLRTRGYGREFPKLSNLAAMARDFVPTGLSFEGHEVGAVPGPLD